MGEFATPGKRNALSSSVQKAVDPEQAPTIGKTTRVLQQTGDTAIDNEGKGAERYRGDNFLNDTQRGLLISEYMGRVNAGHAAYLSALVSAQIDTATQREEEFPILGALLFAAGGEGVVGILMHAAKLLKRHGAAMERLAEAGISGLNERKVEERILGMSEKSVEFVVKQATDQAKDKLKGVAAKATGEEQATEKAKTLSFIDYMKDASMGLFQRFREWPIGRVSDTQLLQLNEAFSSEHQLPSMYKRHVDAIIAIYKKSPAKEIGDKYEFGARGGFMADTHAQTRVAYIANGKNKPVLGYVKNERVTKAGSGDTVLLGQDGEETEFVGYVEPEMQDAAQAMHAERVGKPIETYTIHFPAMSLSPGVPRIDLKDNSKGPKP